VARSTFRIIRAAEGGSQVNGDEGSNALLGSAGGDYMLGGGRDYLQGNAGDDMLVGGAGADGLYGGGGIDWASYLSAASGVRVYLEAPAGNTGDATGDTYNSIENIWGSTSNDVLVGNAGSNFINGDGGADALDGKGGNDAYMVNDVRDTVIEVAGGGQDTVRTSVSYALSADVEVETLIAIGSGAINLTGNALANSISGTVADNVIDGGAGADRMGGREGDDI